MGQEEVNLAGINLNLLVALEALLGEAHVGRAARRVGVTQSAMSQSLRQLRELYRDPLLIRGGSRMTRTPRAEQIMDRLHSGLREIRATLAQPSFDPTTSTRSFGLAASDAMALGLVPQLMKRMSAVAPRVCLRSMPFEPEPHLRIEQLRNGDVDLALGVNLDEQPCVRHSRLYEGGFVGLVRNGSSIAKARLSVEEYAQLSHVVYSPPAPGPSFVDVALESAGLRRNVALRTSYVLVAAAVVAESDHVLAVRKHMVAALVERFSLRTFELPFETPRMALDAIWHERLDRDPGHRWFRSLVLATGKLEPEGWSPSSETETHPQGAVSRHDLI